MRFSGGGGSPLRLGFIFTYWSSSKTDVVAQSPPIPLDCPFCGQHSDAIIKIYNHKTKHYSVLTVGKGKFYCTFVCRNCTTEGGLDKDTARTYIDSYLVGLKYDKIVQEHTAKPDKAVRQLEDLIRKNPNTLIAQEMELMLSKWKPTLPTTEKDNSNGSETQ